jgi:hypothetical protein
MRSFRSSIPVALIFVQAWLCAVAAGETAKAGMDWLEVSKDGKGFVSAGSGKPFTPWGLNYDRDFKMRLLEEYWDAEWQTVVEDFREMKELGANVIRIHLQFASFMDDAQTPNRKSLQQLGRLLALAEETGLYLDITGLACFRKNDAPAWYREATEEQRWAAQARFWEAIAEGCAKSPAVFFYDLMNEPIVAGSQQKPGAWMTGDLAGFTYVQFISLDPAGRATPEIARRWIAQMVAAIRKHDRRHLISLGLLPNAKDVGFPPKDVTGDLDFICVHMYPRTDKLAEDMKTLESFAIGKPLMVEETFSFSCSAAQLRQFMVDSNAFVAGWIGFYWGKTPAQMRGTKDMGEAITLSWLELFQEGRPGRR